MFKVQKGQIEVSGKASRYLARSRAYCCFGEMFLVLVSIGSGSVLMIGMEWDSASPCAILARNVMNLDLTFFFCPLMWSGFVWIV